jgi:hydroxylaminobenzene mutase
MPHLPFDLMMMRVGALTLVAGMLGGLPILRMRIPALALSAHLTGISNGVMLMVLALLWPYLALDKAWMESGRWLAAISLPGLWFALTFAAAVGAGRAAPMAGGDGSAGALGDRTASALIISTSLMILAAAVILAVGLFRLAA